VSVAVSEKTISITQSYRERVGDVRDLAGDLADLPIARPVAASGRSQALPAMAGICPHCGSLLTASPQRRDVTDEPFGA